MELVENQRSDTSEPAAKPTDSDIGSPGEPAPEEVRDYIVAETNMTVTEVEDAAAAHAEESRFVSELSAYYLVALDHGLQPAKVFETVQRSYSLDIEALQPEMNTVDLTAEVGRITAVNTFESDDGSEGQVCNVILQDETGTAVLTLWDDDTALAEELSGGDTVRIENGYSKVANDYCQSHFAASVEVRIGDDGTLLRKQDGGWTTMNQ